MVSEIRLGFYVQTSLGHCLVRIYRQLFPSLCDVNSVGASRICLHTAAAKAQKDAVRANVEAARSQRIYGAPSFVVDDELFWGDDRLEDAIEWAKRV